MSEAPSRHERVLGVSQVRYLVRAMIMKDVKDIENGRDDDLVCFWYHTK